MKLDSEVISRIALGLMFVGTASIGIPFRLRADRAGGRVSTNVDPKWFWILMLLVGPPMVLACGAFLIEPRWTEFVQLHGLHPFRLLGLPLAVMGVGLFAWMFLHLGLNVTSTSMPRASAVLVTSGPYRWVRHPMYSAALLLVIAATLLTTNAIVLIGGIAMFILLAARSRLEEQRLIEKFGEAYRNYQLRTGRFLPNFPGGAA